MNNKQIELDHIEKDIIELFFGERYEQDLAFRVVAKQIQGYINKFEMFCKPLMNEDGTMDGNALIRALGNNIVAREFIPQKPFRLTELSKVILYIIRGN